MSSKEFDTIIVGAGIAGLACARKLQEQGEDFLLISKDIGGRIRNSDDGLVNYGAFFVCSDYYNVLPFLRLGSRIRLSDFCFHDKEDIYGLYEPKLLLYLGQFLRIKKLLYPFRKELRGFRKVSEAKSQRTVIEANPFLYGLYMEDAAELIKEHNLNKGTERYLSKALYSTTFSTVIEMNAFSFLQYLLPLITPIYAFKFEKQKIIAPFKDNIKLESVNDISYKNKKYKIKTKKNTYSANTLVLATEISWSQKYAQVKNINKPVCTNMLHVQGIPKEIISRKKYQLFSYPSNVQAVADLQNGTYLFYYKDKQPQLDQYFNNPKVINHHLWDPAGRINGHALVESNRGNNMYLIGDYNVASLEEAFITGKYAANQIIKTK